MSRGQPEDLVLGNGSSDRRRMNEDDESSSCFLEHIEGDPQLSLPPLVISGSKIVIVLPCKDISSSCWEGRCVVPLVELLKLQKSGCAEVCVHWRDFVPLENPPIYTHVSTPSSPLVNELKSNLCPVQASRNSHLKLLPAD
jgi:hypothetical protein